MFISQEISVLFDEDRDGGGGVTLSIRISSVPFQFYMAFMSYRHFDGIVGIIKYFFLKLILCYLDSCHIILLGLFHA